MLFCSTPENDMLMSLILRIPIGSFVSGKAEKGQEKYTGITLTVNYSINVKPLTVSESINQSTH